MNDARGSHCSYPDAFGVAPDASQVGWGHGSISNGEAVSNDTSTGNSNSNSLAFDPFQVPLTFSYSSGPRTCPNLSYPSSSWQFDPVVDTGLRRYSLPTNSLDPSLPQVGTFVSNVARPTADQQHSAVPSITNAAVQNTSVSLYSSPPDLNRYSSNATAKRDVEPSDIKEEPLEHSIAAYFPADTDRDEDMLFDEVCCDKRSECASVSINRSSRRIDRSLSPDTIAMRSMMSRYRLDPFTACGGEQGRRIDNNSQLVPFPEPGQEPLMTEFQVDMASPSCWEKLSQPLLQTPPPPPPPPPQPISTVERRAWPETTAPANRYDNAYQPLSAEPLATPGYTTSSPSGVRPLAEQPPRSDHRAPMYASLPYPYPRRLQYPSHPQSSYSFSPRSNTANDGALPRETISYVRADPPIRLPSISRALSECGSLVEDTPSMSRVSAYPVSNSLFSGCMEPLYDQHSSSIGNDVWGTMPIDSASSSADACTYPPYSSSATSQWHQPALPNSHQTAASTYPLPPGNEATPEPVSAAVSPSALLSSSQSYNPTFATPDYWSSSHLGYANSSYAATSDTAQSTACSSSTQPAQSSITQSASSSTAASDQTAPAMPPTPLNTSPSPDELEEGSMSGSDDAESPEDVPDGAEGQNQENREKFPCHVCSKAFPKASTLATHMATHTGEKPHICPISGCGRRFSVHSNMRRHERKCALGLSGRKRIKKTLFASYPLSIGNNATTGENRDTSKSDGEPSNLSAPFGSTGSSKSPSDTGRPQTSTHRSKSKPRRPLRTSTGKWVPQSLQGCLNAAVLTSTPPFDFTSSFAVQIAPLPPVRPTGSPNESVWEERNSFAVYGSDPYHPSQWVGLPGPALLSPEELMRNATMSRRWQPDMRAGFLA